VRLATSASGRTPTYDRAFAPFGEVYDTVTGGTTNADFTGLTQDTISGEYDSLTRRLHPTQGRWISPDPAGLAAVNPADPQSWNRYAYASNDPGDLADPSGLCAVSFAEATTGCSNAHGPMGGGLVGDPGSALLGALLAAEAWGETPAEILFIETEFGGTPDASIMFNSPNAQHACIDGYCMVGSYSFATANGDGTWTVNFQAQMSAEIKAAEKKINAAFSLIAQNLGLDPNSQVPVKIQYNAGVWNVSLWNCADNCTVNASSADATGWPDPITYMHNGNSSWYFGSLFGFDAGHLIGSDPASAHIDPFGPLNPLHYLIQMPAMLFPGGEVGYTTCSLNGGCN
jgi:RHS repeat-associated protein